jgi:hypothetical protein
MNVTKLNQNIDNIEDEIYREKLKIKRWVILSLTQDLLFRCADELGDTFDDMLDNY